MTVDIEMSMSKRIKPGVGVFLVLLAVGCSNEFIGPTESRDDSFTVGESPRVVVNGDNGRIVVNPGADGTVRVQATLRRPDDLSYETSQEGDTVSVKAKGEGLV